MARIIKTVGLASGDVLSLSVMNGDTYLDSNVSIAELNELINSPILRPRYRIFLLHPDETIDYQIPDEDILLSGSSYSEQYQNGQRRSLSFSLYNTDKKYTPSVNTLWAESKFALDLGIEKDDGSIVWKRSGVYVAKEPIHRLLQYRLATSFLFSRERLVRLRPVMRFLVELT